MASFHLKQAALKIDLLNEPDVLREWSIENERSEFHA